jgi:hypothetical protein
MKYLPTNTLAYYIAAPQLGRYDLSEVPVATMSKATKVFHETAHMVHPNEQAVTFYVLNHLASLIRQQFTENEPLPGWAQNIMTSYLGEVSEQGVRMFHYLLCISTREMRHLSASSMTSKFWTELTAKFGIKFKEFLETKICGPNEEESLQQLFTHPPDCSMGKLLPGLAWVFHESKKNGNHGFGGSFGGSPWGNIAACAAQFVLGKTSMEAMVDTGFTLEHNGHVLFNKGYMYHSEDKAALIKTLDCQRAGQLAELILDPAQYGVKKTNLAVQAVKMVQAELPTKFRGWVDWYQVEKLGAVGHYEAFKKQQSQQHPQTPAEKEAVEKVVGGKKIKIIGDWAVAPGMSVQQYERLA